MRPCRKKKGRLNLIKSTRSVTEKINGIDTYKVYGGVFEQQFSTLQSDSAYVYLQNNTFDAFGHVIITQGDTLHIYSDKLNYNDNTKIAILTDNVKMVDKDATLTTNNLTYNTATKYGTYVDGGKLVNKDNVLVSKNGYYFANTRDAYFRYNVVMTSPDALIKTDTLRYNSGTRITYFYGPTHIYGKKDKDTLYTENGTYNTKTEQAFFGKKNRYSQGTKSLKGDSLFYDKLKGYGKAIKNVTFNDNEQKMTIKGNLGEYYKADDRAVITQNPYVILVTEEKDTTKAATDTAKITVPATGKDVLPGVKNTIPINKLGIAPPTVTKGIAGIKTDSVAKMAQTLNTTANRAKADSLAKAIAARPEVKNTMPLAKQVADSLKSRLAAATTTPQAKDKPAAATTPGKTGKPAVKTPQKGVTDTTKLTAVKDTAAKMKLDSMYIGADTLETQVVTYKDLKILQEKRRLAGIRDTSIKPRKPFEPYKKIPKYLSVDLPQFIGEPVTYINRPLFTRVKPPIDSTKNIVKAGAKEIPKTAADSVKGKTLTDNLKNKPSQADSLKNKSAGVDLKTKPPLTDSLKTKLTKTDSLKIKNGTKVGALPVKPTKVELSDTSRIRILSAHHNVKIFKSDLQGKSDSLFYSSSDSIIRSFVKPMYWTQGAQISGDTVFLQLKNKKLDNLSVFPSAFIVYLEEADSLHFNQVGGKRLHGYFKDGKLSRMDVLGNAETIYFNRNKKKVVSEMQRSLSSSITVNLKQGQATRMIFRSKPDHKIYPIAKAKEDDKILKGFIWKPKERPANKAAVINPVKEAPAKPNTKGKPPVKGLVTKPGDKAPADIKLPGVKPPAQTKADSLKTDSLKKVPVMKKDSVIKKP
jgi:lipopolysaccharide export system protein LptA